MTELFYSSRSSGSDSGGSLGGVSPNRHRARPVGLFQSEGTLPFDRSALQLIDLWSVDFRETHEGWFSYLVEGYALFGLRGLFLDRIFTLFATFLLARLAFQTDSPLSCPFLIVPVYVHFSVNDLYNYVLLLRRYQDEANGYIEDDASDVTVATVASTCTGNEAKTSTSPDVPITHIDVKPVETDEERSKGDDIDGGSSERGDGEENIDISPSKMDEIMATVPKTRAEILAEHMEEMRKSRERALAGFNIRADISDLKTQRVQMLAERRKDEKKMNRQRMRSESGNFQIGDIFAANYRGPQSASSANGSQSVAASVPSTKSERGKVGVSPEEKKPSFVDVVKSLEKTDFVKEKDNKRSLSKRECVKNYGIRKEIKSKRQNGRYQPLQSKKPVNFAIPVNNYYSGLSVDEELSKSDESKASETISNKGTENHTLDAFEKLQAIPSGIYELPESNTKMEDDKATSDQIQNLDGAVVPTAKEETNTINAPPKPKLVASPKTKEYTWYDPDDDKSWDNSEFTLDLPSIDRKVEELVEDLATLEKRTVTVVSLDGVNLSNGEIGDIIESRVRHGEPKWNDSKKLTANDTVMVRKRRQRELGRKKKQMAISQQFEVFYKEHGFDTKNQYTQLKNHLDKSRDLKLKRVFPKFNAWVHRDSTNYDDRYEETRKHWDPDIWNIKGAKVNYRNLWTPNGINMAYDRR